MFTLRNFHLLAFALVSALAFGQRGTITGTVTTEGSGTPEPLPFVDVTLKNTTEGVRADVDGGFSFSAPSGEYVLLVSSLGYETEERSVTLEAGRTVHVDLTLITRTPDLDTFRSDIDRHAEPGASSVVEAGR